MELQAHLAAFDDRGVGITAVAIDPPEALARLRRLRNLTIGLVSDQKRQLASTLAMLDTHTGGPADGFFATAILVDSQGRVLWHREEDDLRVRATSAELIDAIDGALPK